MIGAVVPAYNRRNNLELLLASLEGQTMRDFRLIVADDGSTDGTRQMVERLSITPTWDGRLRWVGCGSHQGVRTGRARNIGAANLDSGTELPRELERNVLFDQSCWLCMFGMRSHLRAWSRISAILITTCEYTGRTRSSRQT
jgi:glycosyltransferase involved in cell wall biosynthesis